MTHINIKTFQEFTEGDPCEIEGESGTFIFKYASVPVGTEIPNSVTVHGPLYDQQRAWRSFTPDRIKLPAKPKARLPEGTTAKMVRTWARENGVEVTKRGLVHSDVIEQYLVANPLDISEQVD